MYILALGELVKVNASLAPWNSKDSQPGLRLLDIVEVVSNIQNKQNPTKVGKEIVGFLPYMLLRQGSSRSIFSLDSITGILTIVLI